MKKNISYALPLALLLSYNCVNAMEQLQNPPLEKLPETIELKSLINPKSIHTIAIEKQEEQAQERMLTSSFLGDHVKAMQSACRSYESTPKRRFRF